MSHLYEHKVVPILRGPGRNRAEDPEILERDKITAAASRLAVHSTATPHYCLAFSANLTWNAIAQQKTSAWRMQVRMEVSLARNAGQGPQ